MTFNATYKALFTENSFFNAVDTLQINDNDKIMITIAKTKLQIDKITYENGYTYSVEMSDSYCTPPDNEGYLTKRQRDRDD